MGTRIRSGIILNHVVCSFFKRRAVGKINYGETGEIPALQAQTELAQSEQCTDYYEPPASSYECRQRIADEPQLTLAEHVLMITSTILSIATPFLL